MEAITLPVYARKYRSSVLDLMFYAHHVQTHLDWYDTHSWIDRPDVFIQLAHQHDTVVGVMGAPPPFNGTTWLRMIGIHDQTPIRPVLAALWDRLATTLCEHHCTQVALLVIDRWLLDFIAQLGFTYKEDIITLRRSGGDLPPIRPCPVTIRSSEPEDLPGILAVDEAAFQPPWQMDMQDLRHAWRISASCTVAINQDQIVGYQLSTLYHQSAHLARLAVLPQVQGHGVGSSLLADVIRRFLRRSVRSVTVNTQATNYTSQQLYLRYGFQRNHHDLQVWTASL